MRRQQLLVIATAVAATGWPPSRLSTMAPLTAVERPAAIVARFGEPTLAPVAGDSGVTRFRYEDRLLRGTFLLTNEAIAFWLANKSEISINLPWDEAVIVLPDNSPSPIMPVAAGERYVDCRAPRPAAVIPRGAVLKAGALPCKNTRFEFAAWRLYPLFDLPLEDESYLAFADSTVTRLNGANHGKQVTLVLPMRVDGPSCEYTFQVTIESVRVIQPTRVAP